MNVGDRVRLELRNGPCTAYELAASLYLMEKHGIRGGMRLASAWCANLLQRGEVEHVGQVENHDTGRLLWLYRLTAAGHAKLRRR